MSMLESASDSRQSRYSYQESDRPSQPRERDVGVMRLDGFAPHDAFRAAERRPGLAILDYEEGESI